MATSNIAKTKMLEEAVLNGDIAAVDNLFQKYRTFEVTPRALAYAAYLVGSDMTKALLGHGVTFEYYLYGTNYSKNDCWFYEVPLDFQRLLFARFWKMHQWKLKPDVEACAQEERMRSLEAILDAGVADPEKLLYYSILYGNNLVYEALQSRGTSKIPDHCASVLTGRTTNGKHRMAERQEISRLFAEDSDQIVVSKLYALADAMSEDRAMTLIRSKIISMERACSSILFPFCLPKSDLVRNSKKLDIAVALVRADNAHGLRDVLDQGWLRKKMELEYVTAVAHESDETMPDVLAVLLEEARIRTSQEGSLTELESLALDGKGTSSKALRAIWSLRNRPDGTYCITSYKGDERHIVIPKQVGRGIITDVASCTFDWESTAVSDLCRKYRERIESIEYPGTVASIHGYCRWHETPTRPGPHLKRIVMNSGTTVIARNAFRGGRTLQEVVLPNTLREIGDSAFEDCMRLQQIDLPEGLVHIGYCAFSGSGITAVRIPASVDRIDMGAFKKCQQLEEASMMCAMRELPVGMFAQCQKLKKVQLGDHLEEIQSGAFEKCTSLREIELPRTVTKTGYLAFSHCDSLEEVQLSDGLAELGHGSFENCVQLRNIILPASLRIIDGVAFRHCTALEHVVFSAGLREIREEVFAECESLPEALLPDTVERLDHGVFRGCECLQHVRFPASLREIPAQACLACGSLHSVVFPESLSSIGSEAFAATALEKVHLPDTVRSVSDDAFFKCRHLREVHVPKEASIGYRAFEGCDGLADDAGRIIVSGLYFGLHHPLTLEEAVTPLALDGEICDMRASAEYCPQIIFRPSAPVSIEPKPSHFRVGDEVLFGHFPQDMSFDPKALAWRVLDVQEGRALLITRDAIMRVAEPLRHTGIWAQSPIRQFLNGSFLHFAFSHAEREQILMTDVHNESEAWGDAPKDTVFLLDVAEVGKYMPNRMERQVKATEYCWIGSAHRQTEHVPWDLRTSDPDGEAPVMVGQVGYYDYSTYWMDPPQPRFLRPAIWIRTDESATESMQSEPTL